MIRDNILFLREFISEFHHTGTFFPTSKFAAQALSDPLTGDRSPRRILELGPGTGSVTDIILENMIPGDQLSICEINPRFMRALKRKLNKNDDYLNFHEAISFFECAAQDLPEDTKYDVIICSLPFLNFERKTVEEIFAKVQRLSTSETVMTFYQYIGIRSIGKVMAPKPVKRRMHELDDFFDSELRGYQMRRQRVWFNMLPINVYTMKLAA